MNQKGGVGKTTITVNLAAVTHSVLNGSNSPIAGLLDGDHEKPDDGVRRTESDVAVVSTDPQGSAIWWSDRGEQRGPLPFDFAQITSPHEIGTMRRLRKRHIFVDTPGSLESDIDILEAVLDNADDVIVPLEPEPLAFEPTRVTIETVILPRGIPFTVVVNNWDPRDGQSDLIETAKYIKKQGWPMCDTVIRHYKVHTRASAEGKVVTQYAKNRVGNEAREDFWRLALELGYGGREPRAPRKRRPGRDQAVS
jgi:chromosome partitioning protein